MRKVAIGVLLLYLLASAEALRAVEVVASSSRVQRAARAATVRASAATHVEALEQGEARDLMATRPHAASQHHEEGTAVALVQTQDQTQARFAVTTIAACFLIGLFSRAVANRFQKQAGKVKEAVDAKLEKELAAHQRDVDEVRARPDFDTYSKGIKAVADACERMLQIKENPYDKLMAFCMHVYLMEHPEFMNNNADKELIRKLQHLDKEHGHHSKHLVAGVTTHDLQHQVIHSVVEEGIVFGTETLVKEVVSHAAGHLVGEILGQMVFPGLGTLLAGVTIAQSLFRMFSAGDRYHALTKVLSEERNRAISHSNYEACRAYRAIAMLGESINAKVKANKPVITLQNLQDQAKYHSVTKELISVTVGNADLEKYKTKLQDKTPAGPMCPFFSAAKPTLPAKKELYCKVFAEDDPTVCCPISAVFLANKTTPLGPQEFRLDNPETLDEKKTELRMLIPQCTVDMNTPYVSDVHLIKVRNEMSASKLFDAGVFGEKQYYPVFYDRSDVEKAYSLGAEILSAKEGVAPAVDSSKVADLLRGKQHLYMMSTRFPGVPVVNIITATTLKELGGPTNLPNVRRIMEFGSGDEQPYFMVTQPWLPPIPPVSADEGNFSAEEMALLDGLVKKFRATLFKA